MQPEGPSSTSIAVFIVVLLIVLVLIAWYALDPGPLRHIFYPPPRISPSIRP